MFSWVVFVVDVARLLKQKRKQRSRAQQIGSAVASSWKYPLLNSFLDPDNDANI